MMNLNTSEVSEISRISFGILSPEEINKMSCCEVTSVKVVDKGENIHSLYMGTIENGKVCKTCDSDVWECPGHFGHFKLEHPVVNPIFVNDVANILRCICFKCYKFMLSEDHLNLESMSRNFTDILAWVKTIKYCYKCSEEKSTLSVVNETIVDESKVPIDPNKILRVLENMDPETIKFLGFNSTMVHPKNFVFTVFPVIPPCCRPYVISDNNCCDDDLTYQLMEILKNNQYLNEERLAKTERKTRCSMVTSSTAPVMTISDVRQKYSTNLKFRISTYFNNSKKKAKHAATARPITGLKERIAGKEGQIRNNLLGKRCDQSGRTVVGPDPTLKLDELIVPAEMAEILTIPVHVTPFNIHELTAVVNSGKANFLVRASDPNRLINLKNVINFRGTLLHFGDVVERADGTKTVITDTKFVLREGDSVIRNEKILKDILYPGTRPVVLEAGDVVKRQLTDGDYVLLNRQPTLHRASMMALKVVVKPVKTLKVNLAITKPFNCDFDGDEMNIHVPQSYEATAELQELSSAVKCIMSVQNGKPNMTIVQDSLVGLYHMSKESWFDETLEKGQFFDILMALSNLKNYPKRADQIVETLRESHPPFTTATIFNGKGVLSFVFPHDFDYSEKGRLTIKNGVLVDGTIEKNVVARIIKVVHKIYGEVVVAEFIDNVQFVTNKYLTERGFTINAADCLKNVQVSRDIAQLTESTFKKAKSLKEVTFNPFIREQKILGALNNCTDRSMKLSKDALSSTNNFKVAEESGSKGSIYNICQITSMLGQQTIDGYRVQGLHHPQDNEFKNRGFVESSFVEGLKPREFLHHAMAGRKGVIDTALLTSVSGYGQRQGVKLNEDIKIYPDYTVRDINGRLYQYIFGEVGYDPSQTVTVDGHQTICNVGMVVDRLNKNSTSSLRKLTAEEIESMVDFVQKRPNIPVLVEERICRLRKDPIKKQLEKITIRGEVIPRLKEELVTQYYKTLMSPGECVGIIGAQSMGEFSTQATLNTFHVAGSTTTGTVTNCLTRFQEINNATKNFKNTVGKVYFLRNNSTIEEIRQMGLALKHLTFKSLVESWAVKQPTEDVWWYGTFKAVFGTQIDSGRCRVRFILKKEVLYSNKLSMNTVKELLEKYHNVSCLFSPLEQGCILDVFCLDDHHRLDTFVTTVLFPTYVSGVEKIKAVSYHKNEALNVWYVQTQGGTLKDFYALEDVDVVNTSTNNVWDIYSTFGIEAAREFRIKEMTEIMGSGVDQSHIRLRADRLTFTGTVQSLTRYTMRCEKPFSKAGFEEIMENFYKSARDAETDELTGVSASVICGKRAKVGTSMFDVKLDIDRIMSSNPLSMSADDDNYQFVDYGD
jgi:DNA-directed RNA polymerase beta' subunit